MSERLKRIRDLAIAHRMTIATAESCTGGGLAARLTDLPGASTFFLGGIVSYDNRIKVELLGVPERTLLTQGAVSSETARAMADGVRARFSSDLGVGITGVAGPGGGRKLDEAREEGVEILDEEAFLSLLEDKGGR